MMRFILPIILIGISISIFFVLSNPIYNDIGTLQAEVSSYNQALDNSKALENERDKLTAKYNSIDPVNLAKLEKFLPENVNNIRLILEIEQIAAPYGMSLTNVKYSTTDTKTNTTSLAVIQGGGDANVAPKDYGVFDLEFSTLGTYNNFINFTKDLENNLRIVDISSIMFSSDAKIITNGENYVYIFKIKTYWLKN